MSYLVSNAQIAQAVKSTNASLMRSGSPLLLSPDGMKFIKANPLTPPPGGTIQWQIAGLRARLGSLSALLDYGFRIGYEFNNVKQVKQFLGQAQQRGFHIDHRQLRLIESYERQQAHGVPYRVAGEANLVSSRQNAAKYAAVLNAKKPPNVTFKLTQQEGHKPSMEMWFGRERIGSVFFKEHAQALIAIAKRNGAKVRASNPSAMMSILDVSKPVRSTAAKAVLPDMLSGGTTVRGVSSIEPADVANPLRWTLYYLVRKEYKYPDRATMLRALKDAVQAGYKIVMLDSKGPSPNAAPARYGGDPQLREDIATLRKAMSFIQTLPRDATMVVEHYHGKGYRISAVGRGAGSGTYLRTIGTLNTRKAMLTIIGIAARRGIHVEWR